MNFFKGKLRSGISRQDAKPQRGSLWTALPATRNFPDQPFSNCSLFAPWRPGASFTSVFRKNSVAAWAFFASPIPIPKPPRRSTPPSGTASARPSLRLALQARAAAIVHRYGELGHAPRGVFDLMLRHAVSEDGALHAEKYYRTVTEEFAASRPVFRWRQLVALARVTASEYGRPAAGMAEAREILKV